MQPTLDPGDLLLTLPVAGGRGDLVVLRHETGARYVKRVLAVAGDFVELESGRLRVNGQAMDGRPPVAGALVARWDVPPGTVFVVGDNAMLSDDSRTWTQPFVPVRTTRRAARLPIRSG
jgi:signal peptidase I